MGDFEGALNYAFRLLGFRSRTRYELITKLKAKGFDLPIIEQVIEKLKDYKYIDDQSFARIWIKDRCRLKPMGKWRLRQELKLKGIDDWIIEAELESISYDDEYAMAQKLVDTKQVKNQYSKKQLVNFLVRRGFSGSIINVVTEKVTD